MLSFLHNLYMGEEFQFTECKLLCTKVEDSLVVEEDSVYAELRTVRFDSHLPVCSPEELIQRLSHCSSHPESVGFSLGHPDFHPHGHRHTGQDWEIHHVGSQQTPQPYSNSIQTSINRRDNLHDNIEYPTSFLTPPTTPSPQLDQEHTPGLWQTDADSRYDISTSDSGAESSDQTPCTRKLFNGSRGSGRRGQKRRHSALGGRHRDANSRRRQRTCFSQEQLDSLEELFVSTKYVDGEECERIADDLDLSEETVRIWFKNRRAKSKREPLTKRARRH